MKYDSTKLYDDLRIKIEGECAAIVNAHNIAIENWTKEQVTKIFVELCLSGDIVKYVYGDKAALVYEPYRRAQELEAKVQALTALLEVYLPKTND